MKELENELHLAIQKVERNNDIYANYPESHGSHCCGPSVDHQDHPLRCREPRQKYAKCGKPASLVPLASAKYLRRDNVAKMHQQDLWINYQNASIVSHVQRQHKARIYRQVYLPNTIAY